MRYEVVTWHGEAGTVVYVVDSSAPESEQPAILASYDGPGAYDAALLRAEAANEADAR